MLSNTNPTTAPKSTILHITSYGLKGPPLDFEPDVHINARRLINPPSELRKAFDGRCEGLRKNLRADPAFNELLTEAQPRIYEAEEKRRALIINAVDHTVRMVEVNVAVGCVRGRHRSTAVAEELAKLPAWPEHYEVRVHHRDIDTPHRYQKWHQQNLERERKGEMVDHENSGVGSEDSDDEDSDDSQITS
jgi:RNase adaptor protein for sRNA GlmZ degradation